MSAVENTVGLINWIPVERELPDDETTVLLFAPRNDEPVWPGYRDGDGWCWADGMTAEGVSAWTEMPSGPQS